MFSALAALALVQSSTLESGLNLRVFSVHRGFIDDTIPLVKGGQAPNVVLKVPVLALNDKAEVLGLDKQVFVSVNGFLKVNESGAYVIRLSALGPSRMFLVEKPAIEIGMNWLIGSPEVGVRETRMVLKVGNHPLLIEYLPFGQPRLKLEWKKVGERRFETIPAPHLLSLKTDEVVTPGLKVLQEPRNRNPWVAGGPESLRKVLRVARVSPYKVQMAQSKYGVAKLRLGTTDLAWLPHQVWGKEVYRIPSGPLRGHLLIDGINHKTGRIALDDVEGQSQGCLIPAGYGGAPNLSPTGVAAFEIKAVRAYSNGFQIEFTTPMAARIGRDPTDYSLRQWHYSADKNYGCKPAEEEALNVKSVTVSADRRRVFLECKEMRAGNVVQTKLGYGLHSEQGKPLWAREAWYSLIKMPKRTHAVAPHLRPFNRLAAQETAEGFRLLFNGRDLKGFKGFNSPTSAPSWKVENGVIAVHPELDGGDLTTIEQYGDFELRLEWRASPGANSGIIYRASETQEYAFQTGPEMQILDDERHGDGLSLLTSAGSMYAIAARTWDMARPVGSWNEVRIICKGKHIEHWLNGAKIVTADVGSELWKRRVNESKFERRADFGTFARGHIVLQNHGDRVWFRNLRIKPL